jgi:hypothetical protein
VFHVLVLWPNLTSQIDQLLQLLSNKGQLEGIEESTLLPRVRRVEPEPSGFGSTSIVSEIESQIPNISPGGQQHPFAVENDLSEAKNKRQSYAVGIAPELAEELVALYFTKIQSWLPMLHRPRFYKTFISGERPLQDLSLDAALLCNGMLALAARYSGSNHLADMPPVDRGTEFAAQAAHLYKLRMTDEPPTLLYLQGCILLAFYMYSMGPCPRGWLLTGTVVRMAYELDLHLIDEDGGDGLMVEEWVVREEQRRAWYGTPVCPNLPRMRD